MLPLKQIALIIFCFLITFSSSQTKTTDSLLKRIRNQKRDSNQVNSLNMLAMEYRAIKPDTAIILAKQALSYAQDISYKKGITDSYLWIGTANIFTADYKTALQFLNACIELGNEINQKKLVSRAYNNIGVIYKKTGNYPEALKNYFASLQIREEMNDFSSAAACYNNIGIIYDYQNNYTEALKNYFKALKIFLQTDPESAGDTYNNIAIIYRNQNNFSEAIKCHLEALNIRLKINNAIGIAASYNNLGVLYENTGKYDEAIKNHLLSKKIKLQINDVYGLSISDSNIGLNLYKQSETSKSNEDKKRLLSLAFKNIDTAIVLSKELGDMENLETCYYTLHLIYNTDKKFKLAFDNYKLHIAYRDSLLNEENTKKTVQAEMQFEFGKKEAAVRAEQDKKDVITEEEKQKQKIIIVSVSLGLILVLILAIVILRSLRQNQKKNKIITEQKEIVEKQKELVEEKQKEILDSIYYARRIQRALITPEKYIERNLKKLYED